MRITGAESADLFAGTAQRPLQIVRVTVASDGSGATGAGAGVPVSIRVDGPGVTTPVPVTLPGLRPGGTLPYVRTAFELVRLHLDKARHDPDYKFVLAEIDYLKPHFDAHPEDLADLRRFIADGRIEIVGGSYNEPNTNLPVTVTGS